MKTNWKKWIAMKVAMFSRRMLCWAFTDKEMLKMRRDLDEEVRKIEAKENESNK